MGWPKDDIPGPTKALKDHLQVKCCYDGAFNCNIEGIDLDGNFVMPIYQYMGLPKILALHTEFLNNGCVLAPKNRAMVVHPDSNAITYFTSYPFLKKTRQ